MVIIGGCGGFLNIGSVRFEIMLVEKCELDIGLWEFVSEWCDFIGIILGVESVIFCVEFGWIFSLIDV